MIKVGLFVRLEAKPGKEQEIENFLKSALALVDKEPNTITWYAVKLSPSVFAIFDTFPNETGRDAHLSGEVAKALMENAAQLLAKPPTIEKWDIVAHLKELRDLM